MVDVVQQTWSPTLAGGQAARRSGLHKFVRRRSTIAFLMCLPLIVIIAGLVAYPALYAVYLSMLNKSQTQFVWFWEARSNFRYLLGRDVFWDVVKQSAIFALSAVFFKALIG